MKIALMGIFLVMTLSGRTQPAGRDIVIQPTEWFVLNSSIKLHKKFGFVFDGQLRFVQDFENAQHFVRNGFEIYITPKLSIVPVGYMFVWNFQYGKQPAVFANHEQRIWQQIHYRHAIGKFQFFHRFRMEERFLQARNLESDGSVTYKGYDTYLNRIRYRLQVQVPINKATLEEGTWFAVAFDEFFYGWGKGVTFDRIDQNRIYFGIGYQIKKNISVQIGPFYQSLIKRNGAQQENNIGTLFQLGYNFDFARKI